MFLVPVDTVRKDFKGFLGIRSNHDFEIFSANIRTHIWKQISNIASMKQRFLENQFPPLLNWLTLPPLKQIP